jgi:hypothetical protein
LAEAIFWNYPPTLPAFILKKVFIFRLAMGVMRQEKVFAILNLMSLINLS